MTLRVKTLVISYLQLAASPCRSVTADDAEACAPSTALICPAKGGPPSQPLGRQLSEERFLLWREGFRQLDDKLHVQVASGGAAG